MHSQQVSIKPSNLPHSLSRQKISLANTDACESEFNLLMIQNQEEEELGIQERWEVQKKTQIEKNMIKSKDKNMKILAEESLQMNKIYPSQESSKIKSLKDQNRNLTKSKEKKNTADSERTFLTPLKTSKQKKPSNNCYNTPTSLDQNNQGSFSSRFFQSYSKNQRTFSKNHLNFTSSRIKSIFKPQGQDLGPLQNKQFEGDAKILLKGSIIKTKFILCKNTLAFIEVSFPIQDITKLKMIPITTDKEQDTWLKAEINSFPYFFRVIEQKQNQIFSSYRLFSLIINKKLLKIEEQLKVMGQQQPTQHHINKQIIFNCSIYGNIYKKSQVLGKWEKRFIVLKHNGIYSYKNPHTFESPSFSISQESIKYIWTRFELLYENFLIIKIKHGVQQTELAIPLMNYSVESGANWLFHLCQFLE